MRVGDIELAGLASLIVLTAVVVWAAGGADVRVDEVADYEAAQKAGLVKQGWVSPEVPDTAQRIRVAYNIDTGEYALTAALPPESVGGVNVVAAARGFVPTQTVPPRPASVRDRDPLGDEQRASLDLIMVKETSETVGWVAVDADGGRIYVSNTVR